MSSDRGTSFFHRGDRVKVFLATGERYGVIVDTYCIRAPSMTMIRAPRYEVRLDSSTLIRGISADMMEFTGESVWY